VVRDVRDRDAFRRRARDDPRASIGRIAIAFLRHIDERVPAAGLPDQRARVAAAQEAVAALAERDIGDLTRREAGRRGEATVTAERPRGEIGVVGLPQLDERVWLDDARIRTIVPDTMNIGKTI